jgi:uncharacterized membrane protein (DUF4010 family)
LLPTFITLIVLSSLIAFFFIKIKKTVPSSGNEKIAPEAHQNPLEFKTALVFGGLFILFAIVTGYVVGHFGEHGTKILAFVVGVTDIDPFIINLFQGQWNIDATVISMAVLNAITSNNVLKMCYALFLSDKSLRRDIIISFGVIILAGVVAVLI